MNLRTQKYQNDPLFHCIVNMLADTMKELHITNRQLQDAVQMANEIYLESLQQDLLRNHATKANKEP